MRTDDDSWVITTEVQLDLESGDNFPDPVWVRVVAIPDGEWLSRRGHLDEYGNGTIDWVDGSLEFRSMESWEHEKSGKSVFQYLDETFDELFGYSADTILAGEVFRPLLEQVRVPVFGSPPSTWQTIGDFFYRTGGVTGAGVAVGLGAELTPTLILSAAGATLFINIVVPASRAIGRGLEHRINQLMGTPPEPPAASSTEPVPTEPVPAG